MIQEYACNEYPTFEAVSVKSYIVPYPFSRDQNSEEKFIFVQDEQQLQGSDGTIIPFDQVTSSDARYLVKYRVITADNIERYIMVKIQVYSYPEWPTDELVNGTPQIKDLQKQQVTRNSPLELIDSLLHTEGDCTPVPVPVEPVQPQPVVPRRPLGGHSNGRIPTADEKDLLEADTLRVSIQEKSCDEYTTIEAVKIKTQVVAGTNYSVKYRITAADSSVSYILAKIFVPLPHMNAALPEVTAVQKV